MDDVTAIRLRLAELVRQAETDESFHQRLIDDTSGVLAENDIPDGSVDEFSEVFASSLKADDGGECMLFTNGCKDFTCFTSTCPETCYVSIVIHAPDS